MPTASPDFRLFTDGACLGNPGPGGWAFVLRDERDGRAGSPKRESEHFGGEPSTTNNRMELTAVLEGLHAIADLVGESSRPTVVLCSDSEYVLKGIVEWMPNWKKRNWCLARSTKPVKNAVLWRELDALLSRFHVHTVWVRGHTGHAENERCDQLATAEAERQARGEGTPATPRRSVVNPDGLFR